MASHVVESDEYRSLSYARRHWIPRAEGGQPIHGSTLWRWSTRGVRVGDQVFRLKVSQIGGRPMLTRAAVQQFFAELTAAREAALVRCPADGTESAEDPRPAGTTRRLREAGLLT